MTAEIVFSRFPVMSIFGKGKLSEQIFSAASDSARNDYEDLAQRQIQLKRRLKELEHEGQKNSAEYKGVKAELRQIESQL